MHACVPASRQCTVETGSHSVCSTFVFLQNYVCHSVGHQVCLITFKYGKLLSCSLNASTGARPFTGWRNPAKVYFKDAFRQSLKTDSK